jgi:hypothetical protein
MRALTLFLALMILSGCASTPKPRPCTNCGDAPAKATLLQRLGLGRPIGAKTKTVTVGAFATSPAAVSTIPSDVDSSPTLTLEPPAPAADNARPAAGSK